MVFEHLFPESVLDSKKWTAFFLAAIYSTISIAIARLLFAANSGIVSVVFVSIFLLPYFETILKRESAQDAHDKNKKFWHLFRDNWDAIEIYFYLFFGIYFTYMAYAFLSPMFGYDIGSVFREQLSLEGVRGGAIFGGDGFQFSTKTFLSIFVNNWWVLLACFLIALIAGDGSVFFIAWNASTWGTIFGYRALAASTVTGESALWLLFVIVLITLPHVILEGGAYILAAMSGGLISDQIDKMEEVRNFIFYLIGTGLLFVLFIYIERAILGKSHLGVFGIIVVALAVLYMMHVVLVDEWDAEVFKYNFFLFILALTVFLLGAFVETIVLYNASALSDIYRAARFA